MKKCFENWNYKKHATIVTAIYSLLYILDMTLGYIVIKKCLNKKTQTKKALR